MDAVRATHARRVAVRAREPDERVLQPLGRRREHVEGLHHDVVLGGVDDVGGREAVVHPPARGHTDALLHHVDERGDVVVGDLLPLEHGVDGEAGPLADRGGVLLRDHADLGPGFAREYLHLQPGAELGLVGEQRSHLGSGVAGDHGVGPGTPSAAMSVRYCTPGQLMSATAR